MRIFFDNIKSTLEKLNTWFTMNLLHLNMDKTNFMHFKAKHSRNTDLLLNYGNVNITFKI
jgi:hypothetical protein